MRIGIDARMYGARAATGIGAYLKSLTDNLFLIDQKNDYILFMNDPAFSEFRPPNPRVKKIKVKSHWYGWSEQLELPRILLKNKLDLVHFPHFNVPLLYPKKFVVTIHDVTPKFFPGPRVKKSVIRKLGYQAIFKLGVKRAKKVITNSNHTKDNLIRYFKVNPQKIIPIYLGTDEQFKIINDEGLLDSVKTRYNIAKPFILYVGVWRDHKNIPNLIKAFNIFKEKSQGDYQLLLTGSPDDRYPEISEEIKKSKYKLDIITPGFVDQKDLAYLYNAASLFILPSFCEGFGLVALEAMACGTPVAASKTTSSPEILGESAIYFDPHLPSELADVISQILEDDNLYHNLKNKGLSLVKKYNWSKCARETLKVYESS